MGDTDDGKVRLRCPGCGKRVKYPKSQSGETFACPRCGRTIVAALSMEEIEPPSEDEMKAAAESFKKNEARAPQPAAPRRVNIAATPRPGAAKPEAPREVEGNTIERIHAFMARQNQSVAQEARHILADHRLSLEEQVAELRRLRHDRAVRLKKYVQAVLKELDEGIAELRNCPSADTESERARIQPLEDERRALTVYLKVMFELRPASPAAPAMPAVPAAAAAPPNRPSTPAPQTAPGTGNAAPGPGGKAPGSN